MTKLRQNFHYIQCTLIVGDKKKEKKRGKKRKKEKKRENKSSNSGKNSFLLGVVLSLLNVFSIPFYCALAVTLEMLGLLQFDTSNILFFVFGSAVGTLGILMLYTKYSKMIQQKAGRFAKDMNLVLSFLTAIVAVFTGIKLLV